MVPGLALSLLLASSLHAQPPAPDPVQAGADIAAFRAVVGIAQPVEERAAAWADFVVRFPRSPLAEVALTTCLGLGGDIATLLDRLSPPERAFLVASYRSHHEALRENPPEGAALTEAEPADDPAQR